MKQGWKTTEFWVTLVTALLVALNQSGILGAIVLPIESIAGVIGVIAPYVLGRSVVKLKSA
jgi:hypothetical protein